MMESEQVNQALLVHGAILLVALAAYFKYGDRSELLSKSLAGVDSTLARISAGIAADLGNHLRPLFAGQVVNVKFELPAGYEEHPADPVGSEAYREALREFMAENAEKIADLWKLRAIRDAWCYWAQFLSWLILSVAGYEAIASGYLAIAVKGLEHVPREWVVPTSFAVSVVLITAVFGAGVMMLVRHDFIMKQKLRYDAP